MMPWGVVRDATVPVPVTTVARPWNVSSDATVPVPVTTVARPWKLTNSATVPVPVVTVPAFRPTPRRTVCPGTISMSPRSRCAIRCSPMANPFTWSSTRMMARLVPSEGKSAPSVRASLTLTGSRVARESRIGTVQPPA